MNVQKQIKTERKMIDELARVLYEAHSPIQTKYRKEWPEIRRENKIIWRNKASAALAFLRGPGGI